MDGDGIDDVSGYPTTEYQRWKYDTKYNPRYGRSGNDIEGGDMDIYGGGYGGSDERPYDDSFRPYHSSYGGSYRTHADDFSQKKSS